MQLLRELLPQAATIAFLMNPSNPNSDAEMIAAQAAARSLGIETLVLKASNESEIDSAFATMAQQKARALVIGSDIFFFLRRAQLISLTARNGVASVYYVPVYARDGGLMAYGNDLTDMYHLVGIYVGRILKGEKPADLPVVQPTKFEFAINLKTAKALGLTIPAGVLAIADEVIE
jgi:putative tryptophan/tyrosine transport system substrate-binding protein